MFKPSFTKTAVLLASVLMAGSVTAKEMKVGVVNVRAVFSQIPQTAKIQEALKTEFGAKFAEMQKLENDLKFNIEKFKWTPKMIGISLAVVGVLVSLVQGVLVRFVNPKIGNEKSVYIGIGLYAIGLFLFAWYWY